jgi:acyl-CoA thioesterase FadM
MKYLAPAKLEDEIVIKTEVQKNSNARLTFKHIAYCKDLSKSLCSADVEVCLINLTTKKPQVFSNDLLLIFE